MWLPLTFVEVCGAFVPVLEYSASESQSAMFSLWFVSPDNTAWICNAVWYLWRFELYLHMHAWLKQTEQLVSYFFIYYNSIWYLYTQENSEHCCFKWCHMRLYSTETPLSSWMSSRFWWLHRLQWCNNVRPSSQTADINECQKCRFHDNNNNNKIFYYF